MLDPLFMAAAGSKLYRFLRFNWGAGSDWGQNFGLAGINIFVAGVQYPPVMTGPSSPSPWVASSATAFGNQAESWLCFDRINTEYVAVGNGAGWVQLDCGPGFGISPDRVEFLVRQSLEGPPSPLALLGSMDASTWDTLATFHYGPWTSAWRSFDTGLLPGFGTP